MPLVLTRPVHAPSLERLVESLMGEFPGFDQYDLAEMVEERTKRGLSRDDWCEIGRVFERYQVRGYDILDGWDD